MKYFHGMGMAKNLPDMSRKLVPNFNNCATKEMISANDWWNQTIFVLESNETLTRKLVVLGAAN